MNKKTHNKTVVSEHIKTEDDFDRLLKPIKNHLDDNASLDSFMFETYGEELAFVRSQPNNKIWTYLEDGNALYFASGYHVCNRIGYLITEQAYEGGETAFKVVDYDDEVQADVKHYEGLEVSFT